MDELMKAAYDFSKMKGRKNPYASKLEKQVAIRMGGQPATTRKPPDTSLAPLPSPGTRSRPRSRS